MILKLMYEIFVVLVVITYAIMIFADPSKHPYISNEMIRNVDYALIVFFAAEYLFRLYKSENKWKFAKANWFDVVAMLPLDHFFRFARLFRVVRLVRIMRTSPFLWSVVSSPSLRMIFVVVGMIMLWSSAAIYFLEKGISTSIHTFGDAVWWAIVTTTTVGYGDISPVTTGGRVIAAFLMLTGIGLLGALTANFAGHWSDYLKDTKNNDPQNKVKHQMKQNIIGWVNSVEDLSDEEYKTMLDTLEALRGKNSKLNNNQTV